MTGQPLDAQGQVWAIVLAGGEGVRLRPLMRRLYGEDRPKQFATLLGSRCLLRQTLDRVRLLVPADRIVVVTRRSHDGYLAEALGDAPVRCVLAQPEDRGTAAGVLLPAHWIRRQDPDAIIAVFPAYHFIGEEDGFVQCIADMVEAVREHPEWIPLLGAPPTEPDPDHGWIEPGEVVGWSPVGGPISRVRQFREKPSPLAAAALMEKGWLWDTSVFASRAASLIEVARQLLPSLERQLAFASAFVDTDMEARALQEAYAVVQEASFSHEILQRRPAAFVVCRLPALTWSDWGTQERVLTSLRRARLLPPWFEESDLAADPELSGEGAEGQSRATGRHLA